MTHRLFQLTIYRDETNLKKAIGESGTEHNARKGIIRGERQGQNYQALNERSEVASRKKTDQNNIDGFIKIGERYERENESQKL